ncbi:hypothetical protein DXA09_18380 [Absiella sp. AM54-8XD]|uniref:Uncharacterized protein n=3 Tax=Erysipelotrichia TaxID=526524 RepID=A0A7G9GND7_9FIRM|nr:MULTISPECIES: hypothetical protein [Bacillota]QNM12319.1 hypothetical protein H9Q80_19130 [[Eubacterium] hominis]RGB62522.1 hypothetical protein DW113_19270 [Absiella sp. AM09-45]RGB71610.1 hypothetical protein DW114_19825 [Absiella sp. AM09-50]RGC16605.1 hypothetical protein DXA09_18380 [Absiella sp. AM54-8XD]RGD42493.1 hypothetical protein DW093_09640 [Erysipelotrichaceae bacterium AM07-12]RGD45170.1 hypothetical protein DW100_10790 [Erysipelotrichaceae bacterium AM07-35-1]RJV80272.1 hy
MYMYPDNLKGKPTLWLWYLTDIGIIGIGAIFSVMAITQVNFYLPVALVACYAFLTIRYQDTSIFDFIKYACAFFIFSQQFFHWSLSNVDSIDMEIGKKGGH